MNIEYRLYPYPVLTYFSDDYVNSSFTSNLKVGRKGEEIIFHLTANTDDEKLLKLIKEEYAEFVFHIECPSTSYRTIVKSKLGFENISIHESLLNNRINICFFIIAKTQIDNYTNKNFNVDYQDILFNLEKANILAIAKPFNIEIEKEKDDPGAMAVMRVATPIMVPRRSRGHLLEDDVEHEGQGDAGADPLDEAAPDEQVEPGRRGAQDRASATSAPLSPTSTTPTRWPPPTCAP